MICTQKRVGKFPKKAILGRGVLWRTICQGNNGKNEPSRSRSFPLPTPLCSHLVRLLVLTHEEQKCCLISLLQTERSMRALLSSPHCKWKKSKVWPNSK